MKNKQTPTLLELMQARVQFVPSNWSFRSIKDVFNIRNNLRKPISSIEREKIKGKYPYYGPTKIQGYINEYEQDGSYALIGEDGDHFLKYKTQAMTQLVDGKCTVNNHAHIIEGTVFASREWFYYYFMYRDIFSYLSRQGAGRYKLNKAALEQINLLIPPLYEQKKITQILSTWDKAIVSSEHLLINSKQQKKITLRLLLAGKKRFSGFNNSWSEIYFSEAVSLGKEKINPKVEKAVYDCVELEHISQETSQLLGLTTTNKAVSTKSAFKEGSVLFGKLRPYLRKHWLANQSGVCSTEIWVFNVNPEQCTPEYLHQLVQTDFFIDSSNISSGTHMPRADWNVVKDLVVTLPPIEEQKRIAEVLNVADRNIQNLQQKITYLKKEKKALMQQLLTGKRRVRIDSNTALLSESVPSC